MNNRRAWIVVDGDKYDALFLYHIGKNLWGKDREQAKVFDSKKEADQIAQRFKVKTLEVEFDPES